MIRSAVHRLRRKLDRIVTPGGRGAVLLYHRVADEESDPYGLCVTPAQFEQHMQVVRAVGRPMALGEFAKALRDRSLPDRAIAVTFDDGYLDNLEVARPILEKYDVPGLVFVTTGPGGREREFWWDELERIFLQPGDLADELEITIGDVPRRWRLGGERSYTKEQQQRYRHWHLEDEDTPTLRHAIFREVYRLIQPLEIGARSAVLDQLLGWANVPIHSVRANRRAMSPEQVAELARSGIMTIGAHTVNHPALPTQPPEVLASELGESKRDLETWSGAAVDGFAYPYGLFDGQSTAAARAAGFAFACSGMYRPATNRSDLFLIPRIEAPAVDGDTLGDTLRWQLQ